VNAADPAATIMWVRKPAGLRTHMMVALPAQDRPESEGQDDPHHHLEIEQERRVEVGHGAL